MPVFSAKTRTRARIWSIHAQQLTGSPWLMKYARPAADATGLDVLAAARPLGEIQSIGARIKAGEDAEAAKAPVRELGERKDAAEAELRRRLRIEPDQLEVEAQRIEAEAADFDRADRAAGVMLDGLFLEHRKGAVGDLEMLGIVRALVRDKDVEGFRHVDRGHDGKAPSERK